MIEALIGALAQSILDLALSDFSHRTTMQSFREKLRGSSLENTALQRVLAAAYASFSRQYPGLSASLFDSHFLMQKAITHELSKLLTPVHRPDVQQIERLWKAQFPKEPNIDLSIPLQFFLKEFEAEINGQPALKPFIDSKFLGTISDTSIKQLDAQQQIKILLSEIRDLLTTTNAPPLLPLPNLVPTSDESPTLRTQLFICYSHEDRKWLSLIKKQLKPLVRQGRIDIWDDSRLLAGKLWKQEITKALSKAKAALILVSPDFFVSDFIMDYELPTLLNAAKDEGVSILWLAVRSSMYKHTIFNELQALYDPEIPLAQLPVPQREALMTKIGNDLIAIIGDISS